MTFTIHLLVGGSIFLLSNFVFVDAGMWCPLYHVSEENGVMKYLDKAVNKVADKFINQCPMPFDKEANEFCCYVPGSGAACCNASQFGANIVVAVVVIIILLCVLRCICRCCSARNQPTILVYDSLNVPLVTPGSTDARIRY